jgi:plastocyanin
METSGKSLSIRGWPCANGVARERCAPGSGTRLRKEADMNNRLAGVTAMLSAAIATIALGAAQKDLTEKPAVQDAVVNFGYPAHPQPASPANHVLIPDEVTIFKGGTVTFAMHGMGHGIAIYPVSKNTTRANISDDLCQGGPAVCNVPNATAALPYSITDGDGQIVIAVAEFPTQRQVDSTPGQLFSAGGLPGVLLIGSSLAPDGTTVRGSQVRYRFAEDGRYLVICINRVHSLNDWMFGFVNVV